MNPQAAGAGPSNAPFHWQQAQAFARAGLIDDVSNLRRQSVYLFSGSEERPYGIPRLHAGAALVGDHFYGS